MRIETRPRLFTRRFAFVTLAAFAYFTGYASLVPTLPLYVTDELGRGKVAVGVAVAAFSVTALVLRPFVGRLGDRRGRRLLIVCGAGIVAVSTLSIAATHTLEAVVLLRLAGGMGEAMFFVGAATAISDMAPSERRAEAISLFSVSLYAGLAFGPSLGELVHARYGFEAVWLVAGGLTALTVLLGLPTPDLRPEGRAAEPERRRLLHPAGVRPGVVMLTSVWGFAGYAALVKLYARDDIGLDSVRGLLLLYGAIVVAIRLFGARIPDHYGVERIGIIGLAGSAAGLALIAALHSVAGLFIGTAVFAIGQAFAFPAFMAMAANNAPPVERAAAVGTMTAFVDLGFFVGPMTFGVIASQLGNRAAFLAGAVIAVGGLALQLVLRRGAATGRADRSAAATQGSRR